VRTSFRIAAAAAASSIGFLAFAVTPAMASVPGPSCYSGASTVYCDASGGGAGPYTWTLIEHWEGTTYTDTYTTTTFSTRFGCDRGQSFLVSFSYVSGGVTETSLNTVVACNTGDPQ
jgi:hypothetical protein